MGAAGAAFVEVAPTLDEHRGLARERLAQAIVEVKQQLGARPEVVLTAGQAAEAGWLPLQDRMATLSTNSSHHVVPCMFIALLDWSPVAQFTRGRSGKSVGVLFCV